MSQLSKDFQERAEFWEDVNEVITKTSGMEQDLVRKIVLIKDQVDVISLREVSNAFNDSLEICFERKLVSEHTLEMLTDLFEDAMAIETGVFQVVEIYNEHEDTLH